MPSPYRLPTPLPQLPVRKGIRGRRPKSETIALLKALAASTAAQDTEDPGGATPQTTPISQLPLRPYKKRGPKPGSKVALKEFCVFMKDCLVWWCCAGCYLVKYWRILCVCFSEEVQTPSQIYVYSSQLRLQGAHDSDAQRWTLFSGIPVICGVYWYQIQLLISRMLPHRGTSDVWYVYLDQNI